MKKSQTRFRATIQTGTLLLLGVSLAALIVIENGIYNYISDIDSYASEIIWPARRVAGASVTAIVTPTKENTLYEQLQDQQKQLQDREQELNAKEAYFSKNFQPTPGTIRTLYILLGAVIILLILNFILDLRRGRRVVQP